MLRSLVTVAVISYSPTEAEAAAIATSLLAIERPEVVDPDTADEYEVSWFTSSEMPPAGLSVADNDQLQAHRRDAGPDARYFTVLVDRA